MAAESTKEYIGKLVDLIGKEGGSVAIAKVMKPEESYWVIGCEFGKEAEDSDMAGGAIYGKGESLSEALGQAFKDIGGYDGDE